MTCQQIAAEIDVLIDRYRRARMILATLVVDTPVSPERSTSPKVKARRILTQPKPQVTPTVVHVTVLPPRLPRQRRTVVPAVEREPTALSGVVPQGVVFVPASHLPSLRKVEEVRIVEPSSAGHTLEDLVSQLQGRTVSFGGS